MKASISCIFIWAWLIMALMNYSVNTRPIVTKPIVLADQALSDFAENQFAVRDFEESNILAWSLDGQNLAVYNTNGTITLWKFARRFTYHGHSSPIEAHGRVISTASKEAENDISFSPDGHFFASAGGDVALWDTKTARKLDNATGLGAGVIFLAWRFDSRMVVSASSTQVNVFDVLTYAKQIRLRRRATLKDHMVHMTGELQNVYGAALRPDGRILADGIYNKIVLWDTNLGRRAGTLRGHIGFASDLTWNRDGHYLADGSDDGHLFLWAMHGSRGQLIQKMKLGGQYSDLEEGDMQWSPNGQVLAVPTDHGVVLWNAHTRKFHNIHGPSQEISHLCWSPSGHRLMGISQTGIVVWRQRTGWHQFVAKMNTSHTAWCPCKEILATSIGNGNVLLWDGLTGRLIGTLDPRKISGVHVVNKSRE